MLFKCGEPRKRQRNKMKTNRSKKKLRIRVEIENLGTSLPHEDLDLLITCLQDKKRLLEDEGYTDIQLSFEPGWDDHYELMVYGVREETDKEHDARMKKVDAEKELEEKALLQHREFVRAEAKKLGILK